MKIDSLIGKIEMDDTKFIAKMKDALKMLDVAFPAGDYKLNSRQNQAINALLDISFELEHSDEKYASELKKEK